jgi:hypothetical protein
MSKLTNITPENFRCTLGACPAVYTDLTPAEHRCEVGASCPAVLHTEGRYVIIGKRLDPEAEGLSGKVGESEAAVEIPAEILLSALGVTELVEAAKPILDRLWDAEEEAHVALQVGGYAPTDDEDGLVITCGQARALRSIIDRIKGGVNG